MNILVLSDSGSQFRFDNDCVVANIKNTTVRFEIGQNLVSKKVTYYGAVPFELYDGKSLIFIPNSFYVKE